MVPNDQLPTLHPNSSRNSHNVTQHNLALSSNMDIHQKRNHNLHLRLRMGLRTILSHPISTLRKGQKRPHPIHSMPNTNLRSLPNPRLASSLRRQTNRPTLQPSHSIPKPHPRNRLPTNAIHPHDITRHKSQKKEQTPRNQTATSNTSRKHYSRTTRTTTTTATTTTAS